MMNMRCAVSRAVKIEFGTQHTNYLRTAMDRILKQCPDCHGFHAVYWDKVLLYIGRAKKCKSCGNYVDDKILKPYRPIVTVQQGLQSKFSHDINFNFMYHDMYYCTLPNR